MTIWKYELNYQLIGEVQSVTMPGPGSRAISVGYQTGAGLVVWAEVSPHGAKAQRDFLVLFTGMDTRAGWSFLGTVTEPSGLVLHVYTKYDRVANL